MRKRTFWSVLAEWISWRPQHVTLVCPVCGKEWDTWVRRWFYPSGICSIECEDEYRKTRRDMIGEWKK